MTISLPTPLFNLELVKVSSGVEDIVIQASSMILETFEFEVYDGLASSKTTISLVDPTWEFAQNLNIHQFDKGDYLLARYSFGHSEPLWKNLNGQNEPNVTGTVVGTVALFRPEFSSDGIRVELVILGVSLQKVLKTFNQTWAVPASVDNLRDAYKAISDEFKIPISVSNGRIGDISIDPTPFTGDRNQELKLPSKRTSETGLDYLARVYKKYPPTIGGKPTFARFNPFFGGSNQEGVFEIFADTVSPVKRIYRYNGDDSRLIMFSPKINPFKIEKGSEGLQYTTTNNEEKKREYETDSSLASKDVQKIQYSQRDKNVLSNKVKHDENNLFKNLFTAELKIVADINIFRGDIVQVEIYSKLNGTLIMNSTYFVVTVKHELEDGMLVTTLGLTRSDHRALISSIARDLNPVDKLKDQVKDEALSEFNRLLNSFETFIGGIF